MKARSSTVATNIAMAIRIAIETHGLLVAPDYSLYQNGQRYIP